MELLERLKAAGLTGNEAKVYLELLKKGEQVANNVAKNTNLDRSLTYTILNNLINKGQVAYIVKEKKKYFSAANPENLLNPIKKKEAIIQDLIPELKSIKTQSEPEQEITIYEGKAGLRALMQLAIQEKELFAFGSTGWAYEQLYEMPRAATLVKKNKFIVKIIGHERFRGTPSFSIPDAQYRFVTAESKTPTSIFGEYVSIHLTTREKPFIIIIKNKDIADTYRNYFEILWEQATQ